MKPLSILVAALGGEGGGVLCEWLVDAATRAGYPVQGTSIPGVAQRTGATTYYVEISPLGAEELGDRRPVFSLTPVPGTVDLVIASELLEAARVLAAGMVDSAHTTLITSHTRTLTTTEKMALADGRLDVERLLNATREFSARCIAFDMQAEARAAQTVVSAVMFGAIAGSGKLPFSRSFCEAAIEASGKGVRASLAGFARGFAASERVPAQPAMKAASPASAEPRPALSARFLLALERFPDEARAILVPALLRLIDYQDEAYAGLFLKRLDALDALARRTGADPAERLSLLREGGRFLALWMAFDDVVRVADLKTRRTRFARVRREVAARPGEIVRIADYFKPRWAEMLGILPPGLALRLDRWFGRSLGRSGLALALRSDALHGLIALRMVAALRRVRPWGTRYAEEQRRITAWLTAMERVAALGFAPVYELALCARLIKGYGETHARAHQNLERILTALASPEGLARWTDPFALAAAIEAARTAALADPEGKTLDRDMTRHGMAPRPIAVKPVVFVKPVRT